MCATCGWQSVPGNQALLVGERRCDMSLIEVGRSRAIKANEADVRMSVEERAKVVRNRIFGDCGIETS
jgi:hypothetical protein